MATLAVQSTPGKAAAAVTYTAASATDQFSNDGKTVLRIKGGTAPTGTVTVSSTPCSHGRSNEDIAQVVSADTDYLMGPFPPEQYNDANGMVQIATSPTTDIELAAIKLA
jgi:hypothetical protein